LLIVFGSVELVRHYTHNQSYGPAPRVFTGGRVLVVLLIIGTGVLASRVGRNPSVLSALNLGGLLGGLRDSVVGQSYKFTDAPVSASIKPGARVSIENRYGSVKVEGGAPSLMATLTKAVSSWSQDDARKTADRIKLVIREDREGVLITTNRDDLDRQFTTDIEIKLPDTIAIAIVGSYGLVSVNNIRNKVSIQASYADVNLRAIGADVIGQLSYSDFSASDVDGDLNVSGFKRASATNIIGSVELTGRSGTVDLRRVGGPVRVQAPQSKITARELESEAELSTEHGTVEVDRSADVTISAPYSAVRISQMEGDARINASHAEIRVASLAGDLIIEADQAPVIAENIRGEAVIQNSNGPVTLKNFYEGARVTTSYRDVTLVPTAVGGGDIEVNNSHGEIALVLPSSSHCQVDALSENGRVKFARFTGSGGRGEALNVQLGGNGPTIKLRTSYRDITIEISGPGQIEAKAIVNQNR
jgi:DUF4097 and DUF4098 domain-containing protein YvlB